MIDTHCHVTALGLGEIGEWVPLFYPEVKSIKEIVRRIGERAKRTPKGEWIIGRGFDEALLEENRMPTAGTLMRSLPTILSESTRDVLTRW